MTRLPKIGRFILAQFDAEGVIVYQADRLEIGRTSMWANQVETVFSFLV
jgi:hypothetical protein